MTDIDSQLVQKSLAGDADAFCQLVERHQSKVYNLTLRLTGDPEDALDASQETFIRVFKSLHSFKGDSSFATWLYRITNNVVLDELRKRKRRPFVAISTDSFVQSEEGGAPLEFSAPSSEQPEEQVLTSERRREIEAALRSIAPDHRLILLLRDVKGLAYEEIADILAVNVGTVKSRLSRARIAMRQQLQSMEQISGEDVYRSRREARGE